MKTTSIIRWPVALAITTTAVLSGCATGPTTGYTYYSDRDIATRNAVVIRRVQVEEGPYRTGRYRSLEPVAERIYIQQREVPTFQRVTPYRGYRGWRQAPVVPYGPNSPVSPSQWF